LDWVDVVFEPIDWNWGADIAMRRILVLVVVGAGALAVGIGISNTKGASAESTPASEPASSEVPPTMATLHEEALAVASASGDSAPTEIEETSGTLGQVAMLLDPQDGQASVPQITDPRTGRPWSESPAYVITMHGDFTLNFPQPHGVPASTGTVLTLVIDAKSGFVESQSVGSGTPNLRQINLDVSRMG
jgi:hypothetical protein